ncbi:DUF6233 domain-containing protein [Streptomyces rochei]|uniref:DUF6233 domain-containing protein n=1 Tax=Streptomyces rochei TaxID=1928 RepID=UPI0037A972EA
MTEADPPPPPIKVYLPDGQVLRGRLHRRQQFERAGWLYWVGLPLWANDPETETVAPSEYRVFLTAGQAQPIEGVSYDQVPTVYLRPPEPSPPAQAEGRWAFKVRRERTRGGGRGSAVVHVWDCPDAGDSDEIDVHEALDALRLPGAQACKQCDAAAALTPLV